MINYNEDIKDMLITLEKKYNNNKESYYPFIEHIRFPVYKRLQPNSKIIFKFPITVLVGRNGFNKTSILHAIYGSPHGKSVGEYWFSTEVDVIKDRNCFIYGYYHEGAKKVVELLKTRIHSKDNPDYWEPSRPQVEYEMEIPSTELLKKSNNNSTTRWDLMKKNVILIDCKEYVSAYDLFFYHYNFQKGVKYKRRQDYIRQRSKNLSEVIKANKKTYKLYGKNRVKSFQELTEEACEIVSYILEEEYTNIKLVTHGLYTPLKANKPSKTIWMKKKGHEYSEAFAGTGESRVILLVNDILNAKENSLILIDEPEISLHPSAIANLKKFIVKECLKKNHQVVITTHSTHFVEYFPPQSIKVLEKSDDYITIKEDINYQEAFYSIGYNFQNKKCIYVEDKLMKYIIDQFIAKSENILWKENVKTIVIPGGAKNIIKNNILSSSIQEQENSIYLLDGDQKTNYKDFKDADIERRYKNWFDTGERKYKSSKIAEADYDKLEDFIITITGIKVSFNPSGNSNNINIKEKQSKQLRFIDYWENNVFFLNYNTPEIALLELNNIDYDNPKNKFRDITKEVLGKNEVDSDEIFYEQKRYVGKLELDNELYNHIEDIIKILFQEN